ncbi:hypothetical protein [Methylobacterium sp. CM6246]
MTFPLLIAHGSRTAAILEGMNERFPNSPRGLPDMMRDLTFRRTIVESQVALALIANHPDEPASEMVSLARLAIAQCRGGMHELEVERPALPSGSDADGLVASYRRVLAVLLEGVNAVRPSIDETFGGILVFAGVRKRYLGPLAALLVVRCGVVPSSSIAQFAVEAVLDCLAAPVDGTADDPS